MYGVSYPLSRALDLSVVSFGSYACIAFNRRTWGGAVRDMKHWNDQKLRWLHLFGDETSHCDTCAELVFPEASFCPSCYAMLWPLSSPRKPAWPVGRIYCSRCRLPGSCVAVGGN